MTIARNPRREGGDVGGNLFDKKFDTDRSTLEIEKLLTQAKTILSTAETINQFYPVFHKAISKFNGIEITGSFITTDNSADGSMSYVTVGRQADNAAVGDGLGFAWRKSSLIPETYDADGVVATEQLAYNCYLVDNNILSESTFINNDNLVTGGGVNNYIGGSNFLTYGRRTITRNVTYQFKLKITSNYEMTLWIIDDGLDLALTEAVPYGADPNTGVPTNQYGYVAKRGATDPTYSPNADGTHFGISVMNTLNYEWRYGSLEIKSITDDYAASVFRLAADPAYLADGEEFGVYWKGWGQWGDGDPDELGASLFIKNTASDEWELVGTNTASQTSPNIDKVISETYDDIADYRDGNDQVILLATASEAHSTSSINTNYVSIDNITPSGIHTGGMVDIYINDPDKILVSSTDILVPVTRSIQLSEDNGFILPIQSIISVTSSATGDALVEGVDYAITVNPEKNAWSTETSLVLTATNAPASLTVAYRYCSIAASIKAFIESDDYKNPNMVPLIKINPPVIITADTLEYRGDVSEDFVKETLITWINGLTESLEISDLINLLYDNGVDYINLTTLNILKTTHDYTGAVLSENTEITDTYTLVGLQSFFTDKLSLYGVTKLG